MTRLAAVDCGTNSIRLLIVEVSGQEIREIVRTMKIIRLGQGVDATGQLDPAAIERARVALPGGTRRRPPCRARRSPAA